MRRIAPTIATAFAVAAAVAAGACASDGGPGTGVEPGDPVEAAEAYIRDPAVRRAALEASAEVADTAYTRLRMAHYALGGAGLDSGGRVEDDWDYLPLRPNRLVRRLRVAETSAEAAPAPFPAALIFEEGNTLSDLDDYLAAGKLAFELCPLEVDPRFERLRRGADVARSFGFHVTGEGEVRGAVEVQADDGNWIVALSCAACHSSADEAGTYRPGLSNADLQYAELLGAPVFPMGTMDVTPDEIWNAVRPPDLRPLRYQARLHHAGNLGNGRVARMVRIETLITSRLNFNARPDRRVVASMALYLESLADAFAVPDWESEGGAAFLANCSDCHRGDALAGPPVDAALVGTDPAAATGSRGFGSYRAPSLLGASDRRRILHDGTAASVEALLGLEASDHVGHDFGTTLPEATRRALVDFLD